MIVKHPAKFSEPVLDSIRDLLDLHGWPTRIIDPFAGVGLVHQLAGKHEVGDPDERHVVDVTTIGIELEPEWAAMHPDTRVGNALALPYPDDAFNGMVTSPCLAQDQRILTDDLRWVSVGDIEEGDEVLAFDEHQTAAGRGMGARRRWRRAIVVRSVPKAVDCVRVVLETGEEIITTPEHPWLANRYGYGGVVAEWVSSSSLMGVAAVRGKGAGRNWQRGGRQPHYVYRAMETWDSRTSFDAGWLSGMFDGEGSLSLSNHGCPKLVCYQVEGPVVDRVERLMHDFGYEPKRVIRKDTPAHCQKVANVYVTGGFPVMLRALGELRPTRLLDKWEGLDIGDRTVRAEKVRVMAVEPAGRRDIQEIETTEGTYFGEGFQMHNCYGSRMADHHNARDGSVRRSYTHDIGRTLHPDNAGTLQWGDAYRELHARAWNEALRVLEPDALIVVNVSNHIRGGVEQLVTEWHLQWFMAHDCAVVDLDRVNTRRMRFGANRLARAQYENVFVVRYQPT